MRKKSPRRVGLADYMAEVLKNAEYEKGEQLDVIVAEATDLPGCMTQGANIEEARQNLVDTIEVWVLSGLRSGEDPKPLTFRPIPALWLRRPPTAAHAFVHDRT